MHKNRSALRAFSVLSTAFLLASCSSSYQSSGHFRKGNNHYYWKSESYAYKSGGNHRYKHVASDMPLVMNDRVQAWVDYFTGSGRGWFERSLARSGQYMDMMRAQLKRKGLPQDLIYLAFIESGFVNRARSGAGAVGTWQFIQSTGRLYGLDINGYVDERRDPEKAVNAAVDYLADLYHQFGDWYLAMAAYNAGPGRVNQAIAAGGSNDFWEISTGRSPFRAETRDYVPKYIAAAIIAKQPEKYGFHVRAHAPLRYDVATIHQQIDLQTVADASHATLEEIQDLNPELHAGLTPPGTYSLHIPAGKGRTFAREFKRVATEPHVEIASYRARKGDTIDRVAHKYGLSSERLMAYNHLRSRSLTRGELLEIPVTRQRAATNTRVDVREADGGALSDATAESNSDIAFESGASAAAAPQVATATMPTANLSDLATPRNSRSGARAGRGATEFASVTQSTTAAADMQPTTVDHRAGTRDADTAYVVRRGDSLPKIAKQHGVALADLKSWNGLTENRATLGQTLRLAPAEAAVIDTPAAPASVTTTTLVASRDNLESDETISGDPAAAARAPVARAVPVSNALPHNHAMATSYTIRRGDTLASVARAQGVAIADLRRWNNLRGNTLQAGVRLRLTGSEERVAENASAKERSAQSATRGAYIVHKGDTLGEIAKQHGLTIAELKNINGGKAGALQPGMKLALNSEPRITASRGNIVGKPAAGKTVIHHVKSGDTIWDVAKVYKVTPKQIQDWNKLGRSMLKPGQKLTIRRPS